MGVVTWVKVVSHIGELVLKQEPVAAICDRDVNNSPQGPRVAPLLKIESGLNRKDGCMILSQPSLSLMIALGVYVAPFKIPGSQ